MKVLDYYKAMQENIIWKNKFLSTGEKYSGIIFECFNTNFRFLNSYSKQLKEFIPNLGQMRNEWIGKLPSGQDLNKHRVKKLEYAGFIEKIDDVYCITSKGLALLNIEEKVKSSANKDFLIAILLATYSTDGETYDLLVKAKKIYSTLENLGLDKDKIRNSILSINPKKTSFNELLTKDIFWLLTFITDDEFPKIYVESAKEEKEELINYLIECKKNNDLNDLLTKKYKNSGVYSVKMFVNELKLLLIFDLALNLKIDNFDLYIENMMSNYFKDIIDVEIRDFIKNNKSIYIRNSQKMRR